MNSTQKRDLVFLLYGKAAYQAQLLEEQLLQLLLDQKWTDDTMPAKVIEDEDRKLRKLPLGLLGEKFKNEFPLSTHFSMYLDQVKKNRDYLVHHFFRDFRFHCEWGSDYSQEEHKLKYILRELEQCTGVVEKIKKSVGAIKKGKP